MSWPRAQPFSCVSNANRYHLQVAISVEQVRLIFPEGSRWDSLSSRVPDPSKSVALLAVIVIHAVALGGLLAVKV